MQPHVQPVTDAVDDQLERHLSVSLPLSCPCPVLKPGDGTSAVQQTVPVNMHLLRNMALQVATSCAWSVLYSTARCLAHVFPSLTALSRACTASLHCSLTCS